MKRHAIVLLAAAGVLAGCGNYSPTQPTRAAASQPVEPPPIITISGTVTDTASRPLAGVSVEWAGVAEALGDRGHGVLTATDGTYHLPICCMGDGVVQYGFFMYALKDGYATQSVQTTLSETTVNFRLEAAATAITILNTRL